MKGAVFAAILSCTVLFLTGTDAQPPKGCCMKDPQWSASMTDMTSINSKTLFMDFIQADFDKKMQAVVNYTYDPDTGKMTQNSRIVFDYGKKMMYVIYQIPGNSTEQCSKIPSEFEQIRCIPPDAQYLGSSYLGPMAGKVDYDGWRFKAHGSMIVTIAMTREGCVPLVEGVAVPGATPPVNQMYLFANFVPKVTDPKQFALPATCSK